MGDPIRLMIVHQNRLFRECLASVLSESDEYQAIAMEYADGTGLEHVKEEQRPVVILIDMILPLKCTVEAIQQMRQQFDGVKVVVLVPSNVEEAIVGCVQVGADGCVLDEASVEDIQTVIETVHRGESYCSPQIASSMFAQLGRLARESRWSQRIETAKLTTRELDVLRLIADDRLSNKLIARKLSLSLYTVKNHVHNILEKLQVENRYEAAEYAYEQHLLQ